MLTLTENATTVVNAIAEQSQLGESGGLRISADESPGGSFELAAVTQAEPGDQVVERDGATVFLDESAGALLDDKVLDATVDESGVPNFALAQQA